MKRFRVTFENSPFVWVEIDASSYDEAERCARLSVAETHGLVMDDIGEVVCIEEVAA
jgi:hypothetical protein